MPRKTKAAAPPALPPQPVTPEPTTIGYFPALGQGSNHENNSGAAPAPRPAKMNGRSSCRRQQNAAPAGESTPSPGDRPLFDLAKFRTPSVVGAQRCARAGGANQDRERP